MQAIERLILTSSAIAIAIASSLAQAGIEQVFGRTDTQKEIEVGREVYDEALSKGLLSKNDAYVRRVGRILSQLVSALPLNLYPYQAMVVATNEINASCAPGGYIIVYEGLISLMPDDTELASILAHEMGHAYRRHTTRLMKKMQTNVVIAFLSAAVSGRPVDSVGINLSAIRYTREHEAEADAFGTELYLRAGFDPTKVAAGMQVLADLEAKSGAPRGPEYLSTHPDTNKRVASIKESAKRLSAAGLKPIDISTPDLSIEKVFGKLPTIAPIVCPWVSLATGEIWEYEIHASGSTARYTLKVIGVAEVGSVSVARMEMRSGGSSVFYQSIADGDRLWRRNRVDQPASQWTVETVFPSVGEQSVLETGIWQAVAIEDLVTPAGSFPGSMKLKSEDQNKRSLQLWFAPKVGLIKRVNENTGIEEVLVRHYKP